MTTIEKYFSESSKTILSLKNFKKEINEIIESILNPDAIVAPYYVGYEVTTEDGDLFVGRWDKLIDSKRHLQMILANGERVAIAYDEIADQTTLQYSLMPANLHETMTSSEFRDLVQFLSERK